MQTLSKKIRISEQALMIIMPSLLSARLITTTGDNRQYYIPSQSLEHITISMILNAARSAEEVHHLSPVNVETTPQVEDTLTDFNNAIHTAIENKTLKDLV
jgi:DNA-binding IscR family transcriptional regulator